MRKLLLIGSNSIHTYNFIRLIEGYFDDIILLTNSRNKLYGGKSYELNFSFRRPLAVLSSISKIRKIIRDEHPDIIHIHQANTAAWITLKASQHYPVKSIVTAWGSDIFLTPHRGFLYRKMTQQILQNADYFTADADFLAGQLRTLSRKPIDLTVVNYGIDPVCKTEDELTHTMSQKENIIYSNRLHKKLYRIDTIIRSFASFLKKFPNDNWRLVIAATGEESEYLQRLTAQLGISSQTTFTGWIDKEENDSWYRKSKIFVSVPESDATSISMLEAMSAGCIPVLSDLPSKWEWIKNGVNGILTPELNEEDFEKAITLINSDAATINYRLVQQKAAKEMSRKIFFSLYDRILAL